MKKILLTLILVSFSATCLASDSLNRKQTQDRIEMYAKYFGFGSTGQYLNFVSKVEQSEVSGAMGQVLKLSEDPMFALYQDSINSPHTVTAEDVQNIKLWWKERQILIAQYLGISVENMNLYYRYMDYRNLNLMLEDDSNYTNAVEVITVSCDEQCRYQADSGFGGALVYWSLGTSAGVGNYQEFIVRYTGGGTTKPAEVWKGNSYSGVWKVRTLSLNDPLCKHSSACDL